MILLSLHAAVPQYSPAAPLNLEIKSGRHNAITGPRAAGKTLLAEAIAGRRRLVAGERKTDLRTNDIRLVTFMDNSRLATGPNHVHYYQQRFNAFDSEGHPTVRRYLSVGGYDPDEHRELLDTMGVTELLDLEKIKLSSGQTRKVLLARELLRQPRLLIIDNPYVGLDKTSRRVLNDQLDKLVAELDITLVLCGHCPELPACIQQHLQLPGEQPEAGLPHSDRALQELTQRWRSRTVPGDQEIIGFRKVTIRYGNRTILNNLSWKVERGEKWVVSGPNGSGKSTILSLVYADNPQAYAQDISLFGARRGMRGNGQGTRLRNYSIWEIKRRIGFTSPELHTYFREVITVREVVLTGFTDTFTLPKNVTVAQLEMVDLLLTYFKLTGETSKIFPHLSTGTQRLVLLLRALVKLPSVLLLDEPFQGLDESDIQLARRLLDTVLTEEDTLLFISHFGEEVPTCVNRELRL